MSSTPLVRDRRCKFGALYLVVHQILLGCVETILTNEGRNEVLFFIAGGRGSTVQHHLHYSVHRFHLQCEVPEALHSQLQYLGQNHASY
ncbi:hypothetical protein D2E26_0587 [Bifidobacterium dolichotidis]|uniref:Uncharacterized protein n=1 Tax=Bifidobacterium dolichotidis TaxID=2306976 RepID=A0A430FSZ2_9BIFI|nr:hypothetical protein D2E26_0587 [Bifidobacterium dolichotidis]